MTMDFNQFKKYFQQHFNQNFKDKSKLFYTNIDKELIWNTYLNRFPESERQQHTCNSCRQFLKNYGGIVYITDDYTFKTLWDFKVPDTTYQKIVDDLNKLVMSALIKDVYINDTSKLGHNYNYTDTGIRWDHLYIETDIRTLIKPKKDIASLQSSFRDSYSVFKRSLEEFSIESLTDVLDLIDQNNLYKGQEFKNTIQQFANLKRQYTQLDDKLKDNFCWSSAANTSLGALLRLRNTAIGTLFIDLNNGIDMEVAVRKYESVVAPYNYKRPVAIITHKMIEDAKQKLADLGLIESLERRMATNDDIHIDDVLYVYRASQQASVFDQLEGDIAYNATKLKNVKETNLNEFISSILPKSKSIELLLENRHESNLVSLITAINSDAPSLFKWNNTFSWSYKNNLTDSVKEKVKAAGGKVDGKLRISLAWYNTDDYDLHLYEPNDNHIYFGRKKSTYTKGELDVDMNVTNLTTTPVENIIYGYDSKLIEGKYQVKVNNYNQRNNYDFGFTVEIEFNGEVYEFTHDKLIKDSETVNVVEFEYSNKDGIKFINKITPNSKLNDKTLWDLKTNRFHKVNMITYSPNYWDVCIGNQHLFLFLDNCNNTDTTRGFFNEYLKDEYITHKRFFESLGNKLEAKYSKNQLSGVGFSTTLRNSFIVKVDNQLYKVSV